MDPDHTPFVHVEMAPSVASTKGGWSRPMLVLGGTFQQGCCRRRLWNHWVWFWFHLTPYSTLSPPSVQRSCQWDWTTSVANVGVDRVGQKGHATPPKVLENIDILCFESRFFKQNSVIRLKSNILAPPQIFAPPKFLGWLRHWSQMCVPGLPDIFRCLWPKI